MQWSPNKWKVTVNEDCYLFAILLESDGSPVNISGATAVFVRMLKQDGSILELPAAGGFSSGFGCEVLYMYNFLMTQENSKLLPLGDNQTVEIKIMFGTMQKFLTLQECMSVRPLIF